MDDNYVRNWWENQQQKQYFKTFSFGFSYKHMDRFNLKDKQILEIGYGYGRELSQFCQLSPSVFGLDIAPSTMPLAYQQLKEQKIKVIPLLRSFDGVNPQGIFSTTLFDFIYSCFVIQHMSKENAKKLIDHCLLILAPNGRIFFEFFGHPDFMGGTGKDAISGSEESGMYNNGYSKEEIVDLVKRAGGKIEFIEEWPVSEQDGKGNIIRFNNHWASIIK